MKRKKTILYIHHSSALGGAPRSLSLLIKEIDKTKWNSVVLTPEEGAVAQMFRDVGAQVIVDNRIKSFPGATSTVNSPVRLLLAYTKGQHTREATADYVLRLAPDIVHLNSTSLFMAARGAREAAPHVRIICHARETLAGGIGSKIIRQMNHRYCDAFIALDEDGLARLKTKNKETRVVPNFVDTKAFSSHERSQVLRKEHALRSEDVVVLHLARICPINGVLEAIRMIRKLPPEFSNIHFFFFGYSNEKTTVSSKKTDIIKNLYRRIVPSYLSRVFVAAQDAPNIHILPFQSKVLPLLGSADILLCPFTKPHFARSIIEAAAMGIPSIATNVPCIRTLVEHNRTGWLYPINSQKIFEDGLRVLALNPHARARMGEAAKQKADFSFNAIKNAFRTSELYGKS